MTYQSLKKLYYAKPDEYMQIYKSRFECEDTVHLEFCVNKKQVFFTLNSEVMGLAYDIAKLDKSVTSLGISLPEIAKSQYLRKCLIDEIVLTNQIEGVHSCRKEIDEVMEILQKQSEKKKRKLRFEGLVNTYLKLLEHEKLTFTCCKDIRNLYDEIVLQEVVADDSDNAPDGEFFRKEGTEVISATGKVIHKGLYPEKEIISAMEYALNFLNEDSVDKLFRISIFHYMLEYIHPFYDGNGRLGRLILSYGLMETLNPMVAFRISETIKENIKEYYDAFVVCNDRNNLADLTPFLIMMLQMIMNALKILEDSLKERLFRWNRYKELVFSFEESSDKNVRLLYDYLIQASLFGEKGMSTQQMGNLFKTYYLFKSVLNKINPELLITEKYGKQVYYRIDLDKLDSMDVEKV